MRYTSIAGATLAVQVFIVLCALVGLGGVNVITLPWIAIMVLSLSVSLIMYLYGRYIIPVISRKLFNSPTYIGDAVVDGKYFLVTNHDTEDATEKCSGFSIIKLIPMYPATDMSEDEKKKLVKDVEALIYALPTEVEYGIFKIGDPNVKKLLDKIDREIASKKRAKDERAVAELVAEKERLLRSKPVAAIMFIKVFAKGSSVEEVKRKLDSLISQVESLAFSLRCYAMVLKDFDLRDFVEKEVVGQIVKLK